MRLDPTQSRYFWQEHLGGSNCLCSTLKPWKLLKSESTLLLFQALGALGWSRCAEAEDPVLGPRHLLPFLDYLLEQT